MERNPRTDPEVSLFYKHSDHVQGRTWRTAGGSRWFNLRGNSSIYFKYGTRAVPVARFEFCSLILVTQGDVILSQMTDSTASDSNGSDRSACLLHLKGPSPARLLRPARIRRRGGSRRRGESEIVRLWTLLHVNEGIQSGVESKQAEHEGKRSAWLKWGIKCRKTSCCDGGNVSAGVKTGGTIIVFDGFCWVSVDEAVLFVRLLLTLCLCSYYLSFFLVSLYFLCSRFKFFSFLWFVVFLLCSHFLLRCGRFECPSGRHVSLCVDIL